MDKMEMDIFDNGIFLTYRFWLIFPKFDSQRCYDVLVGSPKKSSFFISIFKNSIYIIFVDSH